MTYPDFDTVASPRAGQWYSYSPEGAVAADGSPWYCLIRPGRSGRLVLELQGGGVSVNAYTAARPRRSTPGEHFYRDRVMAAEANAPQGLGSRRLNNPFRNDTVIFIPCANGDFHAGAGDFPYTDEEGNASLCRHYGYLNFEAALRKAHELIPAPKRLIVCGSSAGGFGAALLCESALACFPESPAVLLVDCAIVHGDWPAIAREVWHSPEHVAAQLHSDDLTADCLRSLAARCPSRLKLLLIASAHDGTLSGYESFMAGGPYLNNTETGRAYCRMLAQELPALREDLPSLSLFVFDAPSYRPGQKTNGLSRHCLLYTPGFFTVKSGSLRCVKWVRRCLRGKILQTGLELLQE